jgi:hypothetical protein
MQPSELALQALAKAHRSRMRAMAGEFPDDGGALLQVARFRSGTLRFTGYATVGRILLEGRGLNQHLVFALNRYESYIMDAERVDAVGLSVYAYRLTGVEQVRSWVENPYHAALLRSLALSPDEYFRVYTNGFWLSVDPSTATPVLIERIAALVRALPPAEPENAHESVEKLPVDLQPLGALFGRWAIGDDTVRSQRLARAGRRELAALRRAVEPLLPQIDTYLGGLADTAWSPAAIRLSQLAEAIAELRAREA